MGAMHFHIWQTQSGFFFFFFNGMNCFGIRREEKESRRKKNEPSVARLRLRGREKKGCLVKLRAGRCV